MWRVANPAPAKFVPATVQHCSAHRYTAQGRGRSYCGMVTIPGKGYK